MNYSIGVEKIHSQDDCIKLQSDIGVLIKWYNNNDLFFNITTRKKIKIILF